MRNKSLPATLLILVSLLFSGVIQADMYDNYGDARIYIDRYTANYYSAKKVVASCAKCKKHAKKYNAIVDKINDLKRTFRIYKKGFLDNAKESARYKRRLASLEKVSDPSDATTAKINKLKRGMKKQSK